MFKNTILKNIFSLSLAEFATKGSTFFLIAYIARVFDVEGFGVSSSIDAILGYLGLLVALGFNPVGIRSITQMPDEREKYVNNILSLRFVLAVLAYIALIIYVLLINESILMKTALLFGGLQLFATAIVLDWFYQGIERMEIVGLRQFLISIVKLIGALIFVKSPDDIPIYFLVFSVALIINNLWLIILYTKRYAKIKFQFIWSFWKELLKSSVLIGLTFLFTIVIGSFNVLYLINTSGEYETGLFSAALRIFAFSMVPVLILGNAFIPSISKALTLEEKQQATSKYFKLVTIFASLLLTTIFFYPEIFILIVFGENFLVGVPILRIMIFASFFAYYNSSIHHTLFAWRKEKSVSIVYATGAGLNILLNIFFINLWNGIGAAIASFGTEFFLMMLLLFLLKKDIKNLFIFDIGKLVALALISGTLGILLLELIKYYSSYWTIYFQFIGMFVSVSVLFSLIFKFKIVDLADIKKLFKK